MKKLFTLIAIVLMALATHAQVKTGLVAKYTFDNGNANDEVSTNHGVVNGATLTTDRFGCPNKAYHFTGATKQHIRVTNNPSINFTGAFTLAGWIKFEAGNGDSWPIVKQIPGSWNGYMFMSNNTDPGYCNGKGKFSFYTASGGSGDACGDSLYSNDTARWYFVVGVYNGSQSNLYVNTIKQKDVGSRAGPLNNNADLIFGGLPTGGWITPFTGKLDDIRLYNRVLSQAEIDTLYNLKQCSCTLLNAGKDVSICKGQSTKFNPVGGSTTYAWSPAAGLSSTSVATPTANPTASTTYVLTSSGSGCPAAKDTIVVSVLPGVNVQPVPDTAICTGQSVQLNPSGSGTLSYKWSPAAGLTCTTCANPTATPTLSTTYTVIAGNGTCSDTSTVEVNQGGSISAGVITASGDTLCEGSPLSLTLNGNSSDSIKWQSSFTASAFANIPGVVDTAFYQQPMLLQTTWYRVIVGTGNCVDTSQALSIYVPPPLSANFGLTINGTKVTFTDSSAGSISFYSWDFGDGGSSNAQNPVHTFIADSTYNICLTVYDGSNCSYTVCKTITLSTGIVGVGSYSSLSVSPMPFHDVLVIDAKDMNNTIERVELYDMLGRLILNQSVTAASHSLHINTASLSQGLYILKVNSGKNEYVRKVVKQ